MTEASETIARQVRNAVRETVSARRIQGAAGGGWTEKGIDQILFRGSHDIMRPLASYPSSVVHALMPKRRPVHAPGVPRDRRDRGGRCRRRGLAPDGRERQGLAGGKSVATCTHSKRAMTRPVTCRPWRTRRTPSAGSTRGSASWRSELASCDGKEREDNESDHAVEGV